MGRIKTKYPGVYYRESHRIGGRSGIEKIFYIVFKKDGKMHEEKVGRQYADNMTPAKAARIRAERIEGKRLSRKDQKAQEEAKRKAEENKWTIGHLWEEYKICKPDVRGLKIDTVRFDKYIGPAFGDKEPQDLFSFEIDKFRVNLLKGKWKHPKENQTEKAKKPETVKHILELLRRIVNFGTKKQLCKGLSFTIEMPKVNKQKTEDLTPEELSNLLKSIDEDPNIQAGNLMKMALYTGMRRGELFRLKWQDLDFDRGFIKIRDSKGGKDQVIPLNEAARELLTNHPKTDSPFVFPGYKGRKRTDIKHPVNRIKKRAGLPKDFRALHGLRHVYASMLASSGKVDMYTLQKLLTHKTPQMTQRYAHLRDEALKRAANLAGDIIRDAVNSSTNKLKVLKKS